MEIKRCTGCKQDKNLSDFRKDLDTKSTLSSWCKDCHRAASRRWRANNKNRQVNYDKTWKVKNPDKIKAAQKRHIVNRDPVEHKKRTAIRKLKYNYGLTEMQYLDLLHIQGWACKICKSPSSDFKKKLSVDHCHRTGRVRGLLCSNCNRALGLLKDSVTVLAAAITYLDESSTNSHETNL